MLLGLKAIDLYDFCNTLNIDNIFRLDDLRGFILLISIFPFIAKAIIVYFKVERNEKGEKLKSTKYYQLLVQEFAVFIVFLMLIGWVALILSLIISAAAFCANRIIVKKSFEQKDDKDNSKYFINFRELFAVLLFLIFESVAVNLIIDNITL